MRWGESGTWFVDGREGTSASCSMIQMMARWRPILYGTAQRSSHLLQFCRMVAVNGNCRDFADDLICTTPLPLPLPTRLSISL